jgi:hypothetical protein
MHGPLDYFLWFGSAVLQAAAVVCSLRAKCFFKFFFLNFYLVAACLATALRYLIFVHYGLASTQYFYNYYYSDLLLTICLYLALSGLFVHVFKEMGASKHIRLGAVLVLIATAGVSFLIVRHAQGDLTDANNLHGAKFVYELTQNLYFVGAVLTYLLWFAVLKLHQMHTRVVQIILALGVYFSAFAASYAFAGISPYSWLWRGVCYVAALWLPIAWGYAFLKVPAEAKLMTAQIATGHS